MSTALIPIYGRRGGAASRVITHAKVDQADAETVSPHRWNLSPNGYAVTGMTIRKNVQRFARMHRMLLGLDFGDPRVTHHRNGDKLDNRRENIVAVEHSIHQRFHAQRRRRPLAGPPFFAKVMLHGKHYELGRFQTEVEARRVVDEWLIRNDGRVEL